MSNLNFFLFAVWTKFIFKCFDVREEGEMPKMF